MRFKSTLILGIVFLALAAYVYFFEVKGAGRREETPKEILPFDRANLEELRLTYPDRAVLCLRDSADVWHLVEPIETRASQEEIEEILTCLDGATIRRTVADSAENLADYGLDRPQITLGIRQEEEERYRSLMLGAKNPTGTYAYAKRGDEPPIFLVSSSLLSSLEKSLHDLRFKRVLDFEKGEVNRISLTRQRESIVCSKSLDQWMLERPIRARADGDEIEKIVRRLHEARAKEFVAEEIDDEKKYGFDRPEVIVELFTGERNGLKSLAIGKREGGRYYAKDASRDPVFTVDSSLVSVLMKEATELRDKSVLAIRPYKVQRIRLEREQTALVCQKDSLSTWQIVEPIQVRADGSKINDLLWDLEGLEAEEFVSDSPAQLTPYGLAEPKIRIELQMEGDSTAQILSVGGTRGEKVYVKNSSAPSVYLVDSQFLDRVGEDVSHFRDRKILRFYTYQVRGIEIVRGERTWAWRKDSGGDWKGPAGRLVEKLLSDLQSLKAEEFVEDNPSDLSVYGLTEPRCRVTLQLEEKPPQVLLVGDEKGGGKVYVKNEEVDTIYLTKSDFLEKLKGLAKEGV